MKLQCYTCFDSAMYQYHGFNYKVAEESLKYIEAYKRLGMPVIECTTCGSKKKLIDRGHGRWKEVYVPLTKEERL